MKKFTLTLFMLSFAVLAMSQVAMMETHQGSGSRFTHDFTCMPDYVYGQIPSDLTTGVFCDLGYTYTKVADDYTASGSFNSMKFWGYRVLSPVESFLIEIYDGVPGQAGTNVVHSFNLDITPIATPYITFNDYPVYELNALFGVEVQVLNGWVSISRVTVPYYLTFTWNATTPGNSLSYYGSAQYWVENDCTPAFCLGTSQEIPLSNWALYFGLGMIVVFTIIRFRMYK